MPLLNILNLQDGEEAEVENKAQVNKIEDIQLGDELLNINNKQINIELANENDVKFLFPEWTVVLEDFQLNSTGSGIKLIIKIEEKSSGESGFITITTLSFPVGIYLHQGSNNKESAYTSSDNIQITDYSLIGGICDYTNKTDTILYTMKYNGKAIEVPFIFKKGAIEHPLCLHIGLTCHLVGEYTKNQSGSYTRLNFDPSTFSYDILNSSELFLTENDLN